MHVCPTTDFIMLNKSLPACLPAGMFTSWCPALEMLKSRISIMLQGQLEVSRALHFFSRCPKEDCAAGGLGITHE